MTVKSENGDVGGAVDYIAHPPPPPPRPGSNVIPGAPAAGSSSGTLTPEAQTAMHKEVLEHFQSESYEIPGIEDGELLEVEKFWLVRVFIFRVGF